MVSINKSDDTSKKRLSIKPWVIVVTVSGFIILLIVGAFVVNQKSAEPNIPFTYDIPALIGKNIDQANKELPIAISRDSKPPSGGDVWPRIFTIDKHILIIHFNVYTHEVISFVLNGDNKEKLLEVGNLSENDAKYKIEQLNDNAGMLGIKITPQ